MEQEVGNFTQRLWLCEPLSFSTTPAYLMFYENHLWKLNIKVYYEMRYVVFFTLNLPAVAKNKKKLLFKKTVSNRKFTWKRFYARWKQVWDS